MNVAHVHGKRRSKRKGNIKALGGKSNPFARAMKMSKGKSCNRKAMLRSVKTLGAEGAVRKHCRG